MARRRQAPRRLAASAVAIVAVAALGVSPAVAGCSDTPVGPTLTFESPRIVDPVRAGGEPSVQGLADGTLLYAAHAGTTHLYKPNVADPDFVTPYTGADFVWRSEDAGDTWRYVGLGGTDVGPHATVSGFSDPTFAVDAAGNAYVAGINVANVYVARTADSGKTWSGHPFGVFLTDREWLAADLENVVYLNGADMARGRRLWRSTDGGLTFDQAGSVGLEGDGSPSPLAVDPSDGRLYFPASSSQRFGEFAPVEIFPNARSGDLRSELSYVHGGLPHTYGFLNPIALDRAGNVYIASNTAREIRISYSTDRGATWKTSVVARATTDVLWPWVTAGEDGRVAVVWLQSDRASGSSYGPRGAWRVHAAQTLNGHGFLDSCGKMHPPRWHTTVVTPEPVHVGMICTQGLACNQSADADRRLGDYITASLTADGRLVIAYGNTTFKPGGSISHPAFVRQAEGVDFYD